MEGTGCQVERAWDGVGGQQLWCLISALKGGRPSVMGRVVFSYEEELEGLNRERKTCPEAGKAQQPPRQHRISRKEEWAKRQVLPVGPPDGGGGQEAGGRCAEEWGGDMGQQDRPSAPVQSSRPRGVRVRYGCLGLLNLAVTWWGSRTQDQGQRDGQETRGAQALVRALDLEASGLWSRSR